MSPTPPSAAPFLHPDERLVMVVGGYGSGKTEVSVNLALAAAAAGRRVAVADLDIVNPYFRCREARRLMERHGIRVVVPPGAQAFADLPIILPEIRGLLSPAEGALSLLDVGGDDVGARALAAFRPDLEEGRYALWQVINPRRPFGDTREACLELQRSLEASSRLAVTGLIANAHLLEQTTVPIVLEGWRMASDLARRTGLPVRFVAAPAALADDPELADLPVPVLPLRRHMLPPWLAGRHAAAAQPTLPAARPVPLGRPGPIPLSTPHGDGHGTHRH